MKKFNVYLKYGLLINCIFLLINGSGIFPEFIKGICAGLGLTLIFMGYITQQFRYKFNNIN